MKAAPIRRIRPPSKATVTTWLVLTWLVLASLPAGQGQDVSEEESESPAATVPGDAAVEYRTETVRGKVVWLADALKTDFGISTVPDAQRHILAIRTSDGNLFPLLENVRGRAFRTDKRLRGPTLELLVRRHDRHPMLQVLRVYELRDGKKFEVDYWCDVCAIVMFEKGPCSCCQDDNRLRKRLVE